MTNSFPFDSQECLTSGRKILMDLDQTGHLPGLRSRLAFAEPLLHAVGDRPKPDAADAALRVVWAVWNAEVIEQATGNGDLLNELRDRTGVEPVPRFLRRVDREDERCDALRHGSAGHGPGQDSAPQRTMDPAAGSYQASGEADKRLLSLAVPGSMGVSVRLKPLIFGPTPSHWADQPASASKSCSACRYSSLKSIPIDSPGATRWPAAYMKVIICRPDKASSGKALSRYFFSGEA